MFGIKNPFAKKEDYSDIKDHMIGDIKPSFERSNFSNEFSQKQGFDSFDPSLKPMADFRKGNPYAQKPGYDNYPPRRDPLDLDIPNARRGLLSPDDEFDDQPGNRFEKKVDPDKMINTLLLIKEQLAAIKAQNEMINERLKNLERRTGADSY
jgi:hypothetical protein